MDIETTTALMRLRRELTGESFNDGTIEAWCEALAGQQPDQVRKALVTAARVHKRVTVADIFTHLPPRTRPPQPIDIDNREQISLDEYIRRNPNTQEVRNLARYRHPSHLEQP
jgi:hypothetical protein